MGRKPCCKRLKTCFHWGVATGAAHCNRKNERAELKAHINSGTHTWLWARRRMGKTSLIEQVLRELSRARPAIPSVALDLNVVHDAESLETRIRQAAAALSLKLIPKQKKPPKVLQQVFAHFRPEFTLGGAGMKMILRPAETPAGSIGELLLARERLFGRLGQKSVVVIFQFFQRLLFLQSLRQAPVRADSRSDLLVAL